MLSLSPFRYCFPSTATSSSHIKALFSDCHQMSSVLQLSYMGSILQLSPSELCSPAVTHGFWFPTFITTLVTHHLDFCSFKVATSVLLSAYHHLGCVIQTTNLCSSTVATSDLNSIYHYLHLCSIKVTTRDLFSPYPQLDSVIQLSNLCSTLQLSTLWLCS